MTTVRPERSSAAPPPAILRAGAILDIIANAHGVELTATAIAKLMTIPRSSAVNICDALLTIGFLNRGEHGYVLGPRLGDLGQTYFDSFAPAKSFTTYCQSLRPPLSMTVQLGTLDDFEVVYLAKHDGDQPLSIASRVGGRLPANCTALGKAMLGSLADELLDSILAAQAEPFPSLTEKSLSSSGELRSEIQVSASRGWAIDDEETTPGIVCVAVPLSSAQDQLRPYAVSGSLLKTAATEDRIAEAVNQLRSLAAFVSGR